MFQWYTNLYGFLKKQIIHAVEPVFMSLIKDHLPGFVQITALEMMNHLYSTFGDINDIELEDNSVRMMGAYHSSESLTRLI